MLLYCDAGTPSTKDSFFTLRIALRSERALFVLLRTLARVDLASSLIVPRTDSTTLILFLKASKTTLFI